MTLVNAIKHLIQISKSNLITFLKVASSCFISTNTMAHHSHSDKDGKSRMVWIDLEMTGLDVDNDHILEIACLITDKDLSIVAEGDDLVIHHSDAVLAGMNEWCVKQHGESGLTEASRNSKTNLKEAEKMVLDFVQQYTPKGKCPIAGNSVGMDKQFITKYMPQLAEHLHYRIVDVSTIKELSRRWYPNEFKAAPGKKCSHRAMDDIKESIEELKFYRNSVFK